MRYAAEVSTLMAGGVVAIAAVTVYLGAQPAIAAGLMTAYCVSRLRALATARDIERTSGIRLSVRLQRSVWRKPGAGVLSPRRGWCSGREAGPGRPVRGQSPDSTGR